MNKKIVIILMILLIVGILFVIKNKSNDYLYEIGYTHGKNSYELSIKKDWSIRVKYHLSCHGLDCSDVEKDFIVNFNEENKKLLEDFIKEIFKNTTNNIETTYDEFTQYEKNVLDTIISPDEKKFELQIEKYDYKIVFVEDFYDKYEYTIYFKGDDIKVNKHTYNNFKIDTTEFYNIDFITKYSKRLQEFKNNIFVDSQIKILFPKSSSANYHENLSEKDLLFIKAIIHNDELYLN